MDLLHGGEKSAEGLQKGDKVSRRMARFIFYDVACYATSSYPKLQMAPFRYVAEAARAAVILLSQAHDHIDFSL